VLKNCSSASGYEVVNSKIDVNRQPLSQQMLGFRQIAPLDRQRPTGISAGAISSLS